MFRCFRVDPAALPFGDSAAAKPKLQSIGERTIRDGTASVASSLEKFLSASGSLDGSALRDHWFPTLEADVFISHSHKDKDDAVALVGWLAERFQLRAFVDSSVWGHVNNLLRDIDDRFCLNEDRKTYSYETRNKSTAHVHAMLSTSLTMMLDNTECLFFLDTPNALTTEDAVKRTYSPWLYTELAITTMLRQKQPSDHRRIAQIKAAAERRSFNENLNINYCVHTTALMPLTRAHFAAWAKNHETHKGHALDSLYRVCPTSP